MNQGTIWDRLMEKTRGRKSRATVPLNKNNFAYLNSADFSHSIFLVSYWPTHPDSQPQIGGFFDKNFRKIFNKFKEKATTGLWRQPKA
jgi:hypothetical protein